MKRAFFAVSATLLAVGTTASFGGLSVTAVASAPATPSEPRSPTRDCAAAGR
jgi:hypothetical protein